MAGPRYFHFLSLCMFLLSSCVISTPYTVVDSSSDLVGAGATTNATGIVLSISPTGFSNATDDLVPFVANAITSMEPIAVPPQTMTGINAYNLSIFNVGWDSINISIADQKGIAIDVTGLAATLHYVVDYDLVLKGTLESNATISDSTASIILAIVAEPGTGVPQLAVVQNDFTIGSLDLGLSGVLGFLTKLLNGLFKKTLEKNIPKQVNALVGGTFDSLMANVSFVQYIDPPTNAVGVDLTLAADPIFSAANGILVQSKAASLDNSTGVPAYCTLPTIEFPTITSDQVVGVLPQRTIQCLINSVQDSGMLAGLVNNLLEEKVPLDGRISLDLAFPQALTVDVGLNSLQVELPIGVDVNRGPDPGPPERFITVETTLSGSLQVNLDRVNTTLFNITGSLPYFNIGLGVPFMAADVPAYYKEQISSTNFTELSQEATSFVLENLMPPVNQLLGDGNVIDLPAAVAPVVNGVQLDLDPTSGGFLAISVTIVR